MRNFKTRLRCVLHSQVKRTTVQYDVNELNVGKNVNFCNDSEVEVCKIGPICEV